MIPIPKKGSGSMNDIRNYRGIALSSLLPKLFHHCIICNQYDSLRSDDLQFAYKSKISAIHCVNSVNETVNYYINNPGKVYVCTLDASKAFVRVNLLTLFKKLFERNMCPLFLRFFIHSYCNQKMRIKWNVAISDSFDTSNGVKQGGVLSLLLFNVYLDELISLLREQGVGCHMNGMFVGDFCYADDVTLLAPTGMALNAMLDTCTRFADAHDLSFNPFPEGFKLALIKPHLKKQTLDPDLLKNYRPVSNLHFLSKIVEKVVIQRLEVHITRNDLQDSVQSAYRKQHSTETALLKIHNDIVTSLDQKKCTLLASLDLSAAFDTVDHSILIHRLQYEYGIGGVALQWFRSYLLDRNQIVSVQGRKSNIHHLQCGVPQGSVLGARMYTMYTRQLSDVIKKHDVIHHSYADDTQIYIHSEDNPEARKEATDKLQRCIADICEWMEMNALKLNEEKTEYIIFSRNKTPVHDAIKAGNNDAAAQDTVKILGVTLDRNMTLERQVINTCKSIYMNIRKIRRIRPYLTDYAVRTLVQTTVTVRLDYCNSLYNGLTVGTMKKLQIAQNAAARLISGTMRHEHISGILRELHWLPATKRCQYKLLVLTYQALHGNLPFYICEMLHWYHPSRPLRSAAYPSLVPNKNKTVKFGRRLCDTATAVLWNNLPVHLRCAESVVVFKKQLKTHLFKVL